MKIRLSPLLIALSLLLTTACSSTYFSAMEKMGYPKRELFVTRLKAAQSTQEETKEQFSSALERFKSVVEFDGGSLEDRFNTLSAEYDESEAKADELHDRIDAIEDVAEALFEEWEDELEEYKSARLRANSAKRLSETQTRYKPMVKAMRRTEKSVEPVLAALHDQVLYLKHNLNAQAVGSLRSEVASMESDVAELLEQMEASIQETDRFIKDFERSTS